MRWRFALVGGVAAGMIAGGAAPLFAYDIAGHWTGSGQERGRSPVTLTVDFATSRGKVSGTIAAADGQDAPVRCPVNGKVRHGVALSLRGTCDDGGTITLHGRVSAKKQTIAGTYVEKRNRRRHHGTFTVHRPAGGTAVTGTVRAPTANLAAAPRRSILRTMLASLVPRAYAQSLGLTAVPGANVLLFAIDDAGRPTSTVPIATATSDASGNYSLVVPSDVSLGSTLVVQASTSTAPAPVGSPGRQSCPATQTRLDLSPISEYATRALIAAVASNTTTLANYTPGELNALIAKVTALAQDPGLVGATIEDTIANITNAIDPSIRDDLRNDAAPGEAELPSGLGGTYNFVNLSAGDSGASITLAQHAGTLIVDLSARTFSFTGPKASATLDEACTADQAAPCSRAFTRDVSTGAKTGNGSVTLLGGNQILFEPANGERAALGFYGSTGDVMALAASDGLIVAFKAAAGPPALAGGYHGVELATSLPDTFTVAQGVPFSLGDVSTALIDPESIAAGSVSGTSTRDVLSKDVTCNGGATCSYTETVSHGPGGGSFTAPLSVDATGVLTVSPAGEVAHPGAVSADGALFAFLDGDPSGKGNAGLVIGTRQGTGMTTANLHGSYGFVSYTFTLGPGARGLQSQSGILNLDGNGGLTANLLGRRSRVDTGCAGAFCPPDGVGEATKTDSPNTTYAVTATGGVTISDSKSTIAGFASPDGSLLVLAETHDGAAQGDNTDSERAMFVMLR